MSKPYRMIEPARGATYDHRGKVAVYEYGRYGPSSVLAGQTSRRWLDEFDTVEAAQAAYPDAEVSEGSLYQAPYLDHLPDGPDL